MKKESAKSQTKKMPNKESKERILLDWASLMIPSSHQMTTSTTRTLLRFKPMPTRGVLSIRAPSSKCTSPLTKTTMKEGTRSSSHLSSTTLRMRMETSSSHKIWCYTMAKAIWYSRTPMTQLRFTTLIWRQAKWWSSTKPMTRKNTQALTTCPPQSKMARRMPTNCLLVSVIELCLP